MRPDAVLGIDFPAEPVEVQAPGVAAFRFFAAVFIQKIQRHWFRITDAQRKNIAHLYNITKMCDCMNQKQNKIIANIGFLVGRNPFAVDWLAQELISEKIRADKAHFHYARDKFFQRLNLN